MASRIGSIRRLLDRVNVGMTAESLAVLLLKCLSIDPEVPCRFSGKRLTHRPYCSVFAVAVAVQGDLEERRVILKIYRDSQSGLAEMLRRLKSELDSQEVCITVPQLYATCERDRVFLWEYARGRTLLDELLAARPVNLAVVRKAAKALADLQRCPSVNSRPYTTADLVMSLNSWLSALPSEILPDGLCSEFHRRVASRLRNESLVLSNRCFIPGHLYLSEERFSLIDWDQHRLVPRAYDVGLFLSHLRRYALEVPQRASDCDAYRRVFTDEASRRMQDLDQSTISLFEAAQLIRAARNCVQRNCGDFYRARKLVHSALHSLYCTNGGD